jgi:hypothetical protein
MMTQPRCLALVLVAAGCAAPPAPAEPTPPPPADHETGILARLARDGLAGGLAVRESLERVANDAGAATAAEVDNGIDLELERELERLDRAGTSAAPGAAQSPYANYVPQAELVRSGAIAGRATWAGAPLPAAGCAPALDPGAGVDGAIVTLLDVHAGRVGEAVDGLATRRACGWQPAAQVVSPIGARLRIVSAVDGTVAVRGTRERSGAFAIDLPERGSERLVRLAEPGLFELADGTGSNAWIAVAAHPYTTSTDRDGRFRLAGVPPGSYTLEVWVPPRADAPPLRQRARVRVSPARESTVTLALP